MLRTGVLFLIITISLISGCTYSQSATGPDELSFELIPYDAPDIIAPGRGAEQWHNGSEAISYPTADTALPSMDVYYRFTWNMLEDSTEGSYRWDYFDGLITEAIDKGQKLSFGIMTCYGDDGVGVLGYDGGRSAYPLYLHRSMQSDGPSASDWLSEAGTWVPNWNSPHYLNRLRALHEALYQHILSSTYTPKTGPLAGRKVPFQDAIYCIDVRGYGHYGEWHNSGLVRHLRDYPRGRIATEQTLKSIIDHHTQVFDRWPLVMMIAAFDGEQIGTIMVPVSIGHYALHAKNAWGPLGWRRDQWGATDGYLDDLLKNNRKKASDGPRLKDLITTRYQAAPVTGEPPRYVNDDGRCPYWNLEQQVEEYGASSIGNGNWGIEMNTCAQENARAAFKRAGYRIILEGGSIPPVVYAGQNLPITLHWKNIGVAPTYEEWEVHYLLRDSSGKIAWTARSAFKPKLFLPQKKATIVKEEYRLPESLATGNYTLDFIIADPRHYRVPLPLAIKGRQADGCYQLRKLLVEK